MPDVDVEQIQIKEDVDFFIIRADNRHVSHATIFEFLNNLGKILKQKGIYREQPVMVVKTGVSIEQLSEEQMNMYGWFRKETK